MKIDEAVQSVPPPRHTRGPSMRQEIIRRLLGMDEQTECLVFTDEARTQRQIASIVRTIAHQINIKIVTRNDVDGKTVRVWRKL